MLPFPSLSLSDAAPACPAAQLFLVEKQVHPSLAQVDDARAAVALCVSFGEENGEDAWLSEEGVEPLERGWWWWLLLSRPAARSLSSITPTHILLQQRAFLAVVCVRDARPPTHAAPARVGAVVALVANPDKRGGADERVANHALAVAPLAQAADGW